MYSLEFNCKSGLDGKEIFANFFWSSSYVVQITANQIVLLRVLDDNGCKMHKIKNARAKQAITVFHD